MKKKLLSLVLAGAMVASTSVSAFAATISTTNGVINGSDENEYTTDVEITGKVMSDAGQLPNGTLSVTVSTAASFVVDENSNLEAGKIVIQNDGDQDIDVFAEKFVDTRSTDGIKVVPESQLKSVDRTNVSLTLTGKVNTVYLKSEDTNQVGKTGLYSEKTLTTKAENSNLKLTTVSAKGNGELTLAGKAGTSNDGMDEDVKTNGLNDKFTLTLKIKKSDTN